MEQGKQVGKETHTNELRQIPRWASCYANNRALPMLVIMLLGAVVGVVVVMIMGLAAGALRALRTGHPELGWALVGLDAAVCAGGVWLALSRGLKRWLGGVVEWMYRGDGMATAAPATKPRVAHTIVAWVFMVLACMSPVIAQRLRVPEMYLQPVTALYMVPLMLYMWWVQGRSSAPFALWAVLYAAHAVALLAGVPLLRGMDPMMQVPIPLCGYAVVAVVASHLYSRYALRKLRALAKAGSGEGGEEE
jgi:hypothetical protein